MLDKPHAMTTSGSHVPYSFHTHGSMDGLPVVPIRVAAWPNSYTAGHQVDRGYVNLAVLEYEEATETPYPIFSDQEGLSEYDLTEPGHKNTDSRPFGPGFVKL